MVDNNEFNVGLVVKRLCEEKDITPAQLERDIDLSNGSVYRWIKGDKIKAEALAKLADYFKVSTDYLLGRVDYKTLEEWNKKYNAPKLAKEVKEIETIAAHLEDKNLTPEKVKMLTKYIDFIFQED